ncbi:DeoR/GlpR transcriptional regulator [Streptomyces anulatus]
MAAARTGSARRCAFFSFSGRPPPGHAPRPSRFRVLPWEKVGGLITDAGVHDPVVGQLAALGVEILTAGDR